MGRWALLSRLLAYAKHSPDFRPAIAVRAGVDQREAWTFYVSGPADGWSKCRMI
ncbi:hypothetical protein ACFV9C_43810 [Kribbella sp. NPDC059898]|uniref:hypothetical protein n=1 Tax=Kribbella sp. NPDC059898 TaxID=3346995 RepID=UPI00364B1152